MKSFFILILLILFPLNAIADCEWSDEMLIPLSKSLSYETCPENNTIRINNKIIIHPNIPYETFPDRCPDCIVIWTRISPDHQTAIVWIENNQYQRNAWVIDLASGIVKLFIDASKPEGRHFLVEFNGSSEFIISHAGMGYRTDYYYKKVGDAWANTGREKIDIK